MIFCFSGTGNSAFVADVLSRRLHDRVVRLTPELLASGSSLLADQERVIWVFPVYSWGVPPYVRRFIAGLDIRGAVSHHLVMTCGDDAGLTASMWRKDIALRGWQSGLAFTVIMPNNYVCMTGFDVDSKQLAESKLAAAGDRIDEIIRRLSTAGREVADYVTKGSFAWFKTRIIYPWFVRYAMSPKPFRSSSACISCGKCAAICPTGNIVMSLPADPAAAPRPRKRPSWGDNCAGCLACYHVCPRHAVEYGKSTLRKGQYLNPVIYPSVKKNVSKPEQ